MAVTVTVLGSKIECDKILLGLEIVAASLLLQPTSSDQPMKPVTIRNRLGNREYISDDFEEI